MTEVSRDFPMLGYGLNDRCSILGRGWLYVSSSPRPDRLWMPPNLLQNGYWGTLSRDKVAWAWSWPVTSIYSRGCEYVELYLQSSYVSVTWCLVKYRMYLVKPRGNFTLPSSRAVLGCDAV